MNTNNKNQINLINWRDVRREQKTKKYLEINLLIVLVLVGMMLVYSLGYNRELNYQRSINNYLNSEIATLNKELATISSLEKQIKDVTERMEVINSLQSNRSDLVMLLDEIAKKTPKEITLSKLKSEKGSLEIIGTAISQLNISKYLNNLKNSIFFEKPMLEQVMADEKVDGFERSKFFIKTIEKKQSSLIKEDQPKEKDEVKKD